MGSIFAFVAFPIALAVLVITTDYFLENTRKIGVLLGVRSFVMGLLVVAFGTSFPEAVVSLFSVLNGLPEVPVAQVVGSNIANILLVLGVVALLTRRFFVNKRLLTTDLPLVVAITLLFVLISFDGIVLLHEGLILCLGFVFYVLYIFYSGDNRSYPATFKGRFHGFTRIPREILLFIVTSVVIAVASHFAVVSMQSIASSLSVPEGLIAVTVLAIGTSLPELVVSIQAVLRKETELVIGSIIGSNIFNILFVVGISALTSNLIVDSPTLFVGIPALVGATLLFVISGISGRISAWEGLFYLLLYVLVVVALVVF